MILVSPPIVAGAGTAVLDSSDSNSKFASLYDLFPGLSAPEDAVYCEREYRSAGHTAREMSTFEFETQPSKIMFSYLPVSKLIPILIDVGRVEVVYSSVFMSGIPTEIILRIIPKDGASGQTFYMCLDDACSFDPKEYPEYADCIIESDLNFYNPNTGLSSSLKDSIFCMRGAQVFFHPDNQIIYDLSNKINEECQVFVKEDDEVACIEMIVRTGAGLETRQIDFDFKFDDKDLDLHYGEGFSVFYDKFLAKMEKLSKGIAMFHGPPGNGKSFFIKRLLPKLNKMGKRVILIPKHVLGALESPGFNEFMIRNFIGEEIVFVIEDAEAIIAKRENNGSGRTELVSTLLNITDGLLNDIFSIQVVLTFNTDLKAIDEALTRKGRLIARHCFENLDRDAALKLAKHLNIEMKSNDTEFSLADVYAMGDSEDDDILISDNKKKKKKVTGF